MKRTNVVLDDELLEDAVRLSGERTYAATIDRALREMVKRYKVRALTAMEGTGWWDGDLSEMRGDVPLRLATSRAKPEDDAPRGMMIADRPPKKRGNDEGGSGGCDSR